MEEAKYLTCTLCGCVLENGRVGFNYLGHHFFAEAPCCPKCGQVYLSEELVRGRIADIEEQLEDK